MSEQLSTEQFVGDVFWNKAIDQLGDNPAAIYAYMSGQCDAIRAILKVRDCDTKDMALDLLNEIIKYAEGME